MSEDNPPDQIAKQIVSSADSVLYLSEAMGKSTLPNTWKFGPSIEIRIRFRPRVVGLDDGDLSRRIESLGIHGPLRVDRLENIALEHKLNESDKLAHQSWRPHGFGFWRLDEHIALGVKVYVSARPAIDLMLAIPPFFQKEFSPRLGFAYWTRMHGDPDSLRGFSRLTTLLFDAFRRAQPIAHVEAVHVQDQSWVKPFQDDDVGFLIPEIVCSACNLIPNRVRDGWASVNLDVSPQS